MACQCSNRQESDRPLICGGNTSTSGHDRSSSLAHQLDDLEYHQDAVVDHNFSDLRSLSIVSDSLPRFDLPGDDHAHATTTYSPGFLVFDNDCGLRNGNLLHLNVLSISSNFLSSGIAEINSPGSRRNSGRLFWDALSRHNFRRHRDSPTIVFATDLADARRDGFLISAGISILMELKEIWVALTREANRLHFLHLDSTLKVHVHANRSLQMKIPVLLKVLDEIHHQSLMVLSSTLLLPAPESVVDAFPLKYHKEIKNVQSDPSDIQQCYICLTDYEKGDKLSVLPCNHEFYVPCIDKWLKEVNRYVQSAETMCVTVLENVPPKTQKHHYYNTLL